MNALIQDLRHAGRALRQTPGFTLLAALTLALGLGVNTSIFSVVNGVLLSPLPLPDPDRLVLIRETIPQFSRGITVSYPDFLDWRERSRSFEGLAVYNRYRSLNLTGTGEPERIATAMVSGEFFEVLGVAAAQGRTLRPEDDAPGAAPAVVLSHALWQRRFAGEPGVVGRSLTLDGQPFVVVGVMPRDFRFPSTGDLWVPIAPLLNESMLNRGNHPGLFAVGRLRRDSDLARARADLAAVARQLEQEYPDTNAELGVIVEPLAELLVRDVRPALGLLSGAVGLVVLVACANVANLLLARTSARRQEMAVRGALGAGRGRLARLLLAESLLLALGGGAGGLLLAAWTLDLIRTLGAGSLPNSLPIELDGRVLAFAFAVSLVAAVLLAGASAWQVLRSQPQAALGSRGGSAGGPGGSRRRGARVVAECALAVMLLVTAGLLVASVVRLARVDPGFRAPRVASFAVKLPATYDTAARRRAFFRESLERLASVPGVEAVGVVDPLPFSSGGWQTPVVARDLPPPAPTEVPLIDAAQVSPDYFEAMGIPLLRGRSFTDADREGAPPVAIVSRALAEQFWPGQEAVGRWIKQDDDYEADKPWLEVVGVVGDVRLWGLEEDPRPQFFFPYLQLNSDEMSFAVRGALDPTLLIGRLEQEIRKVDADLPVFDVATMDQRLASSLGERRFAMRLLGLFAGLATFLASLGIYGVMAYSVVQRRHEIGVRMALGAGGSRVLRLVVADGLRPALLGAALGLAGALGTGRLARSLLWGVAPTDPATFALAALLLAAVAFAASYLPALRAARLDPMVVLRHE